ncbi:NAD(P)H-dependent flavin oxidoreductase [Paenalcaligenes niemegkensis]|uniref:NAD(P)H-dependent flavin oxidoreductase n=1 Tax=Paenalcaligenes niemegkensis TaxID=2895469 RepID=UPI0027E2E229|nr:nitronate monooxygenase [Paenalcaligenes niemegkensis]
MTQHWPTYRLQQMLGINKPLILAPMAGAGGLELALGVSKAGGLASLPCALLEPATIREQVSAFRETSTQPLNLNFFCHQEHPIDESRQQIWLQSLAEHYEKAGLNINAISPTRGRASFNDELCSLIEELKPEVLSFHFGLPSPSLIERIKRTGAIIMSSATSAREALHLESEGCDIIIAQGAEAGGHRGMFIETNPHAQCGTMALVPQIVDAVRVPVVAAGGIADGRGIAAAFALGAAGVQIGSAYLACPESLISDLHRQALSQTEDHSTVLTTVFTGRPARSIENRAINELGATPAAAPAFPHASNAIAPLRAQAEQEGRPDFTPSGQGKRLG